MKMFRKQFVHLSRVSTHLQRNAIAPCIASPAAEMSTNVAPAAADTSSAATNEFRTGVTNPGEHSELHVAKFYTIPVEEKKQIFSGGGLPKQYEQQIKTFTEACLMVRSPALELLQYIKNADLTNPAVRYVLYGDNGVGKTLTMAHVLHYGALNEFLLVHVPWAPNWMKRPKEAANSASQEGFIDLPFDAAAWLVHFKTQNAKLLGKLQLKTSKEYVWSKRESTPAGAPLMELVEHGIARIKYASETTAALLAELKQLASARQCKIMVAIDGFNAFFHPITRIFSDNKQRVTPERITLTQPFLDITNYDWTNGVCVLSVDKIAMTEGYMASYMPRYLLGKDGFEHLDPFVPVHVGNYTDKEFLSYINYYLDRHWISRAQPGFEEQLKFMSNMNPYTLMQLVRGL
ncbi:28S ribosomal protein S29, mitochondrial [Drosophila grimshawi]|uniref:Small ribosomal subunit protein mS29 n=1 Tax=Drosophila grimshawi TaxID=7222 RepID=B4J8N5_DROGR|nr:28S ribosomal protein S29, mitochondrial [Drosophila grimshawi]EDW01302.1 GH20533 [Drosophila grimshawi]